MQSFMILKFSSLSLRVRSRSPSSVRRRSLRLTISFLSSSSGGMKPLFFRTL